MLLNFELSLFMQCLASVSYLPCKFSGKGRHDLFPYSLKCDIYSYGLVLHELAVGRSPWVDYVYEEHMSEKGSSNLPNQPDEIVMMVN